MNLPKYLVEIDPASIDYEPRIPTRPLWIARLRDPFCLARIDAGLENYEGPHPAARIHLWPAILEVKHRGTLVDGLARALFREHDLYPDDWGPPVVEPFSGLEPPEFLDMIRPGSDFEMILEPHAPRLWKKLIEHDDATGCEWVRDWGPPPEFPEGLRRVTEFLRRSEFGED